MKVKNNVFHAALEDVADASKDFRLAARRLKNATRKARKEGYTLKEIASAAGVSDVTILNWEKNDKSE